MNREWKVMIVTVMKKRKKKMMKTLFNSMLIKLLTINKS